MSQKNCQCRGVSTRENYSHTMQNLVVVSYTVCTHVGGSIKISDGVAALLKMGPWHWVTPRNTLLPHMCYGTEFGRFRSNRVGLGRGFQSLCDAAPPSRCGAWLTPKTCSSTTCVTIANLVTLVTPYGRRKDPKFGTLGLTSWNQGVSDP